jgi:hypothetical protein
MRNNSFRSLFHMIKGTLLLSSKIYNRSVISMSDSRSVTHPMQSRYCRAIGNSKHRIFFPEGKRGRLFLFSALVLLLMMSIIPVSALLWTTETVDNIGNDGVGSSLQLDSAGNPHISYMKISGNAGPYWSVHYANKSGTTWAKSEVDPAVGGLFWAHATSLALDNSGNPHISYYNHTAGNLWYADRSGGWNRMVADNDLPYYGYNSRGSFSSIAINSTGYPHIAYQYLDGGHQDLKYASWDGASWSNVTAPDYFETASGDISLALDSTDVAHIASGNQSSLIYTTYNGVSWTMIMVDNVGGQVKSVSIALDGSGNPRISYYDSVSKVLKYAQKNGGTWTKENVSPINGGGDYNSLALDSAGNPHISYTNETDSGLNYASKSGSSWVIEEVEGGGIYGECTSLKIDNSDRPHISYWDRNHEFLKYAVGSLPASRDKIGVFRNGAWYLDASNNGWWDGPVTDLKYPAFGTTGDLPVAGNWSGDGKTEIGVFRNGAWFLDSSGNGWWDGPVTDIKYPSFGTSGDLPVAGNWSGSGRGDIGVFRNGAWYLDYNGNGWWDGPVTDLKYPAFGTTDDKPVAGDWNGDGLTEIGVFRNGAWYLDFNGNGWWDGPVTDLKYPAFGTTGDKPVAGDWNSDEKSDIGVFRNGAWYLDKNGNGWWDGPVTDLKYPAFGTSGDMPVTGNWPTLA